ncbi:MAG: polyphosphate kinase 2 family protein [Phycisphaerales bacterium]|nr:polyphosphate kinase 2 family protein [Phycisphaerae bacterium]NNF42629.1 polyphosphate kinase 2 family protein [Phycisphaerales bacterium]NNM25024.1 polyphosphate kinase 2 family protein [Phycisphaerales bacterium]
MPRVNVDRHRVRRGTEVRLGRIDTKQDGGLSEEDGKKRLPVLTERLAELQELMYAEGKHALLIVLQAMDAAGKDSTIRHVFGPVNPQGCRVASFKVPTSLERRHDFLWRVHRAVPPLGSFGIFNRSHYEDVLVVRVKKLASPRVWKARFDHINAFERLLTDNGVAILKFYLHISKGYQKRRFERRLERPDKRWKFNVGDLEDRARWGAYRTAYEEVFRRCSTTHAPWYVVPAERRWYRNLVVAQAAVNALEKLKMRTPKPDFDPASIRID